jgi:hypothetical protein
MHEKALYDWETLPEYLATQQYARCLGRIFRSLPRRIRRGAEWPMTRAAILISQGIAGFNAEPGPEERLTARERELFREGALEGIAASREGLDLLGEVRRVSRPDILVARELLERIEESIRSAQVRPDWL